MAEEILFADVILSLHLPYSYCYRVPKQLNDSIQIGQRVAVQFGSKKLYSAIVVEIHSNPPKTSHMKYILDIIDLTPTLTQKQIEFFSWVKDYYVAYIGDVLSAALPTAFRLKSETVLEMSPYFTGDLSSLNQKEDAIVSQVLKKGKLKLGDYEGEQDGDFIKTVNDLIKKDILTTDEELYNQYQPKYQTCLELNEDYKKDNLKLKTLFDQLDKNKNSAAQSKTLLLYCSLSQEGGLVKKSDLLSRECSASSIQTLIKKGVLVKRDIETTRLNSLSKTKQVEDIILNQEQQQAFDDILSSWNEKPITLLHGVTGSGKTEVYIKIIDKIIQQGGQILYLIPEIAITFQLIDRLQQYFGDKVAVYNSKFSTMERAEVYNRVKLPKENPARLQVILGSRSSVFLPFTDLRLVVVDEEHDTSFKQTEPVPHYNGKDCALYLARMFGAKTILGSATPSLESYYLASQGKYQLVEIKHRYSNTLLPEIYIADVKEAMYNQQMYGIFTKMLHDAIEQCLKNNKQVILFQNRRGYSPHIKCNICGYVPKCPNCDVSLVLHKQTHTLECHYCGYTTEVLRACPDCNSHSMRSVGTGTEKIEEELKTYFPSAQVMRMDLDSTRNKNAYTEIIQKFSLGKIDILTGTQIVTKGLDFDNVGLVGVIDADTMLHYPDFRAFERAFQTLIQVSGRSGRRDQQGKVVIQTFDPYNQVIRDVSEHNYTRMYQSQIQERKMLNFPPFCKMIKITLMHKDRYTLHNKAVDYAMRLQQIFGSRMFGPQEPAIARIRNLYIQVIWLKIEKSISFSVSASKLREMNEEFLCEKDNKTIKIQIDVDPV